jgi:hypothetical protein
MSLTTEPSIELNTDEGMVVSIHSLLAHLQQIPDPRQVRGIRYPLTQTPYGPKNMIHEENWTYAASR